MHQILFKVSKHQNETDYYKHIKHECPFYLSSIQVVCNLEHQEKNSQGFFLNGVSLPVFYNGPTQREQRVHLAQLTLHQQQLQKNERTVKKQHR